MNIDRRRRPLNALLVDDDQTSRVGNLGRLEREGYRVTCCPDAAAGLRLAKDTTHDVIFLHIGQEGSGSLAFLEELRANDHTRHVPVVLLSGRRARRMARLGLNVVANGSW
jgi:DNA-binding response OmpR family regulator